MSNPEEKAPSNIWMMCKCGHEEEADGHKDFELMECPACHRLGCWVVAPDINEDDINSWG